MALSQGGANLLSGAFLSFPLLPHPAIFCSAAINLLKRLEVYHPDYK